MNNIISISGAESSGKSTLAARLMSHYQCHMIPEQSRIYLKNKGKNYLQKDLEEIAKMYLNELNHIIKSGDGLIITDTSLLDILVWSEIKYGSINKELKELCHIEAELFYLLCAPDLKYESDPLRENPSLENRMLIHRSFEEKLKNKPNYLGLVHGQGEDRIKNAIGWIDSNLTF